MTEIIVNSDASLNEALKAVRDAYKAKRCLKINMKIGNVRTGSQNSAMHKYFKMLADKLNEAGLDQREVIKPSVDMPWSENSVKEHLWRPIQLAVLDKESTTKLNRDQVSQIYDILNRNLSEKLGIYVEFPSKD